MWSSTRTDSDLHFVCDGRVGCPRRGRDVEVDQCLDCRELESHDLEASQPLIRCKPDGLSLGRIWQLFAS